MDNETTTPSDLVDKPVETGFLSAAHAAAVENGSVDDLVRATLLGAQRVSRTMPARRRTRRADRGGGGRNGAGGPVPGSRGGYSSSGADPQRDPLPVGAVLSGYAAQRGWSRPLAEARVFTDWSLLVGRDVAAHCRPESLRDGLLHVSAESTAWATQLRILAGTLLARLAAELGPDVVARLSITGPVTPSWKHGGWSVPGHRGPRDTYG